MVFLYSDRSMEDLFPNFTDTAQSAAGTFSEVYEREDLQHYTVARVRDASVDCLADRDAYRAGV